MINDKFYFVDLPGYGYARAAESEKRKWGKLVNDYLEKTEMLRGLCFLLDCRREPNEDDLIMIEWMESRHINFVVVLTKADKLGRNNLIKKIKETEQIFKATPIPFSSMSGIGKKELMKWIGGAVGNPL